MSFTDMALAGERFKMLAKVAMITGASAVFGIGMGIFMGSFEYNMSMAVDTNRNGWS